MKKTGNKRPGKVKPNYKLDGEDAEMLAAIENGEVALKSVDNPECYKQQAKQAASNYFAKNERVSFRISTPDLNNLKRMAANEGLPYQTYLASIIHKLTTGQLNANS